MLATLLPGIRHVRAPLAAGYLWLLALWTVAASHWPHRAEADGLAKTLYEASDQTSIVGKAVAASFIAYLLGSLSEAIFEGPLRALARRVGFALTKQENDALKQFLSKELDVYEPVREGFKPQSVEDVVDPRPMDALRASVFAGEGSIAGTQQDILSELEQLPLTLINDKPAVYAEVDRIQAEAEFRLALTPPLVAIVGVFTASEWLAVLGAIPVGLLYWQGIARQRTANGLVSRLIRTDVLTPRILEDPGTKEKARRRVLDAAEKAYKKMVEVTEPGFVNQSRQAVLERLNPQGPFYGPICLLQCTLCKARYVRHYENVGASSCPKCQNGSAGLTEGKLDELGVRPKLPFEYDSPRDTLLERMADEIRRTKA